MAGTDKIRKKSVQFSLDVLDERDTQCGIPGCRIGIVSDIRFLVPLALSVVFIQGIVAGSGAKRDVGLCAAAIVSSLLCSSVGRDHKPRWLGAGTMCTAMSCVVLGIQEAIGLEDNIIANFVAQFFNGLGLVSYVTLGISYIDDNFQRHLPVVLGFCLSLKTVGDFIRPPMDMWFVLGVVAFVAALPIALLPKIINRISLPVSEFTVVTPMDDPSKLKERRNSILYCFCNPILVFNAMACAFFLLGVDQICNQINKPAMEIVGFLLLGWFIQFVKPRGRILAGVNVLTIVGISVLAAVNAFYCGCSFGTVAAFSTLLFLSCCGRIGSFLFCMRTVEKNDKPVALGLTLMIVCLFLVPKKLLIGSLDLQCHFCEDSAPIEGWTRFKVTSYPCSQLCCDNNKIPSLIGSGLAIAGAFCDFLIWRVADFDVYDSV